MRNKILILISLFLLLIFIITVWPNDKYRIIFCDVGQGDGVLISHKNTQMLVDTGAENKKMLSCLENFVPFWDRKIEAVVVTHWDEDHAGGMRDIIKSYKIDSVYSSSKPKGKFEQINYSTNLAQNDLIKLGLISFEILSPEENEENGGLDNNDMSVVGLLSYKDKKFLLTGDAPKDVEDKIAWQILQNRMNRKVDVLKVSHHGSDTATSEDLLKVIQPQIAIISVGKNNKYGHPKDQVLKNLEKYGVTIKRTDIQGNIVFDLN